MILSSVMVLVLVSSAFGATTVFSDDFSTAGDLDGMSADVGGTWSVDSGAFTSTGGVVDTGVSNGDFTDEAFASFTESLAAGEQLALTFVTTESAGEFAARPWAGVSLYVGNSEEVFLGSPGGFTEWGITGLVSTTTFSPSITAEPQTAVFGYAFDTGGWSFTVNGEALSGTATTGLAFDRVRIGSDANNRADIAVSSIDVTITPEPATMSLLALGGIAMLKRRKR
jgi:hypothetical protein